MNLSDYHAHIQLQLEATQNSCLDLALPLLERSLEPALVTYRPLLGRGAFFFRPPHIYVAKPEHEAKTYTSAKRYQDWLASLEYVVAHEIGHYAHLTLNRQFRTINDNSDKVNLAENVADLFALYFLDFNGKLESYLARCQQQGSHCYFKRAILSRYRSSTNPASLVQRLMKRKISSKSGK